MIRDLEIQRLVNYTKGLGLKVTFSSKKSDYSAHWSIDNSEIVVFNNKNKPKIVVILDLIHELGHSKHNVWEKDRQVDPKFEKALDHVDDAAEHGTDTKKRHRKTILNNEIAATRYWEEIYHETDMKFPLWRLEMAKEFDIYQYEIFYETGRYPTAKEKKQKRIELTKKYRGKNV